MDKKVKTAQSHQSGLRSLMSEAHGKTYTSFKTLSDARTHPDAVLIFEGDHGGTIYLTMPVAKIQCDESALRQLLTDIDSMYWNDARGAGLYYEPARPGMTIPGGMGGGKVLDNLWLHSRIEELDIRNEVKEVLSGTRAKLEPRIKK